MTIELRRTQNIPRPATEVWEIVADYGRDPEWRAGVTTMAPSSDGPVEVGTTTCEDIRFGGRRYLNGGRVVAVEPGRSFSWETTSGARARGGRTVVATGACRCQVELTLQVTPAGLERLLAPMLARMLDRQLQGDVRRLAALAVESTTEVS